MTCQAVKALKMCGQTLHLLLEESQTESAAAHM